MLIFQFVEYYIWQFTIVVQSYYEKNVIEISYLVFRQFLQHVLRLEQVHILSCFDFFSQDPSNWIPNLTFYLSLPEILQTHCYLFHYNVLILKKNNFSHTISYKFYIKFTTQPQFIKFHYHSITNRHFQVQLKHWEDLLRQKSFQICRRKELDWYDLGCPFHLKVHYSHQLTRSCYSLQEGW